MCSISENKFISYHGNTKQKNATIPKRVRCFRLDADATESYKCIAAQFEGKGKAIPLQALTGPEGSRRLRLPDFKTIGT
jgi:hypothetical protein